MRLLILTQAIDLDDANLGFFHEWVSRFARRVESVDIIAQRVGKHALPANIRLYAVANDRPSKYLKLWRTLRLCREIFPRIDRVFIHMAPVYAIVAYPFAWRYRTPMALWYVHRHVDLKLRLAEKLVDGVFSASPESFRLPSKKVSFLGHGVDTDLFAPPAAVPAGFVMLTAGRISRSKRVDFLLRAVARAREHLPSAWKFMIVGGLITGDDARYRQELDKLIRDLGMGEHVSFEGEVPYRGMPSYYQKAHMFLHASATGSIDKAVLEAMSTALPVVSSSEAFWTILPEEYVVKERSVETFASKISALLRKGRDMSLRGIVQEKFELSDLIKKLEMQLIALSVPID